MLLRIADKPVWWLLLLMIPVVNVVVSVMIYIGLAEAFNRGVFFAFGLMFLPIIFYPILAFGRNTGSTAAVESTVPTLTV